MSKQPRKRCYNCKHGGDKFKIDKLTHLHCQHPKHDIPDISPWDTLCEWWSSCDDWESNQLTRLSYRAFNNN